MQVDQIDVVVESATTGGSKQWSVPELKEISIEDITAHGGGVGSDNLGQDS